MNQQAQTQIKSGPVGADHEVDLIGPDSKPLAVVRAKDKAALRSALQLKSSSELAAEVVAEAVDPELDAAAEQWTLQLVNFDMQDPQAQRDRVTAIETLGQSTQEQSAQASKMLDEPIRALMAAGAAEGSPVAKSLIDLKVRVDEINPARFNLLEPGSIGRFFAWIPGVGTTMNSYFTKFQTSGSVIESILAQLKKGSERLRRDTDIYADDQTRMRLLTIELERVITTALLLDAKLEREAQKLDQGSEKRRFLDEEIRFPLRQRIQDLQQQLVVNQQGVIGLELVMRNNRELIRGAKRTELVTVSALRIAVTIAIGLAHQRIVLNTIKAIDTTTDSMIAHTSQVLRQQGTAIQKDASSQKLNIDTLRKAFSDLAAAIDDISTFRQNALPEMGRAIAEMKSLSTETEAAIQRMEKGNKARPSISFELAALPAARR